jgi:DNA-binding MarR family transcriptional regulator
VPGTFSVDDHSTSDEVVDAVIAASRALVGLSVRSINSVTKDVTVSQYRSLVILVSRGPQRIADLASLLGVEPSTATRMAERLERRGLALRSATDEDRRVVRLSPTDEARDLVARVTQRRRADVREILRQMPPEAIQPLIGALRAFSAAAGEPGESAPSSGWVP